MILVGDILLKWGKLENDIRLMFKKMKMFKEKKNIVPYSSLSWVLVLIFTAMIFIQAIFNV